MKKVAVEKSLENVKIYLQNQGYEVTVLENTRQNLNNYDAIIVSGQNTNVLGIQDTDTRAPVINAKGMSVEDIYNQLMNRFT